MGWNRSGVASAARQRWRLGRRRAGRASRRTTRGGVEHLHARPRWQSAGVYELSALIVGGPEGPPAYLPPNVRRSGGGMLSGARRGGFCGVGAALSRKITLNSVGWLLTTSTV